MAVGIFPHPREMLAQVLAGETFKLAAECQRIKLAGLFGPMLAGEKPLE